ncbi:MULTISPECIES: hypothetical protein [unclassified Mycolicibacterium]|uniref:hypothetical protein n=1 Tax=unclassified Mycolicibacterium TaxID=2636767 RepID=UPI0012DE386A|nr:MULTISPECIES: hypothetical protein [unclassified Mycolicibacterium]MUL83668.1 hypothetical protein [Mycolicibacterium sp. CBMA 329]MUL90659.1 hypothetical protein [Mycolicibacterium sp. CBMA 331]MUM00628.1 hypothetical protein [Mycolicibacterium sp. CBMA 334]MUM28389.1 hypothetical protein [Mycolicibacterium sp. CBMA 295]MUM41603.1 hypothetical protein [Mycolicibacterium sp. CBMA 247]
MSYPDPYHPPQQPPPGPYPPGPQGYGYPPNGGYPPAQPYQAYGAPQQPPYYPPPTVTPQPDAKRSDGNSWGWQIMEGLLDLFSGSSSYGLGKSSRDRVKTALIILGTTFAAIAIVIAVAVMMSK